MSGHVTRSASEHVRGKWRLGVVAVSFGAAVSLGTALTVSAQTTPPEDGSPPPAGAEETPGTTPAPPGTAPAPEAAPTVGEGEVPEAAPAAGSETPPPVVAPSDPNRTPWENVIATTPPPTFLETTDTRIEDDRPPPTADQVAALREMEAEVGRFSNVGRSYRDTVLSLVRRDYLRQRRARDQSFARQIREEERLQNEARDRAIRLFERFIARHPDDERYTPDAMFRLGELYFERSALRFQELYDSDPENAPSVPDFAQTIELYQRLVQQFPSYRNIDGVFYLIAYCLNEMARADEARMAWLNLVCANRFTYDPQEFVVEPVDEEEDGEGDEEQEPESPALTLDGPEPEPEPEGPYVDPYAECTLVQPDADFVSETWFRIGEYHFDDYSDPRALDLAISAYNRILAEPDDRNYNLALYKVAWAYYRASRYPEAIRHFGMLVQWSDDERARTGRAGSELRPEAVQYLGISFAYDDWNENQVPDPIEGSPTGIQRIQNADLLPQDREWTPEVYFSLGEVYFEENKLPEAIEVWQLALDRFPNHPRAPEITNNIARAYARNQEMQDAISWRARLGDFGEGSDWWNENVDHPREQREAEQLAENALVGTAIHYHQEAQQYRRRCVAEQDIQLCNYAQENYTLAAQAYQAYLDRYPNNPQAYELRYNLADAYYWSENYEEAAGQYAAIRDSNLDDTHLSESARRVVESLKRILDADVERGAVTMREDPPAPQGDPPVVIPLPMPELVQRLAQARETYLARVPERNDSEQVRAPYDFNNALLLYLHGYWPQAKERFERIFDERCSGPNADATGQVAWLNLRNMAASLGDDAELQRLATVIDERGCTFTPDGGSVDTSQCEREENRDLPQCVALRDINAIHYRQALDIFRRAEQAQGDEQRRLYEEAAAVLIQAVNDNPDDPQAPVALEYAATALERTSRFESAARLYQRIVDEVGPLQAQSDEERDRLDAILANAYFRLAYNANRFFDFDRAVENYRLLADADRFEGSSNATILERREGALINAAAILERLQQYGRAATYYQRAADALRDPAEARDAAYRVAEMSYKRRNWSDTVRRMNAFIDRYRSDGQAGELVVQAHWRIAQARKEANARANTYDAALRDVVSAFGRSGQPPASLAAEYGAHSAFLLADDEIDTFERFSISASRPRTMQAYVTDITNQINRGSERAQSIVAEYEPVLPYRRPVWTIAAYVRQGRTYEILARAVLNTEFVVPADLQAQMRRLPPEDRDQIRLEVETTIQGVLDQRVRPIECFAVARYALAVRAARAGSFDNEYTQQAVDRLQAYGDERIAECIAEAQRTDPSFQAYQPGEFRRAPRGLQLDIPAGISAPGLAPMEGR